MTEVRETPQERRDWLDAIARDDRHDLPTEVSRGIVEIAGLKLELVYLDNGMRLITEESLNAFLEWVETGGDPRIIEGALGSVK
jgi:hypothetical protein